MGYFGLASSFVSSAPGTQPIYVYSPSSGTASYQLPGGNYIAIVHAQYLYSVYPNTTNINMQYGIQYGPSSTYTASSSPVGTNISAFDTNVTYGTLNQNYIYHISPVVFTVPPGNTNYYYSYAYFGLGSINNGGNVTASVKIVSLTRIG